MPNRPARTRGTATIGSFISAVLAALSLLHSTWDSAILSALGLIIGAVAVFNNRGYIAAWAGLASNLAITIVSVSLLIIYHRIAPGS